MAQGHWQVHTDASGIVRLVLPSHGSASALLTLSCDPSTGAFGWQLVGPPLQTEALRALSASIGPRPDGSFRRFGLLVRDDGAASSPTGEIQIGGTVIQPSGASSPDMRDTRPAALIMPGPSLDGAALMAIARDAEWLGRNLEIHGNGRHVFDVSGVGRAADRLVEACVGRLD